MQRAAKCLLVLGCQVGTGVTRHYARNSIQDLDSKLTTNQVRKVCRALRHLDTTIPKALNPKTVQYQYSYSPAVLISSLYSLRPKPSSPSSTFLSEPFLPVLLYGSFVKAEQQEKRGTLPVKGSLRNLEMHSISSWDLGAP